MKRIILSVLTMSALLCGCQKDHVSELAQERGTIQATIEEISSTRTVMDEDNNIRWSEGDQIVGFMRSTLGVKYQVTTASVGKTSASFEEVSSGGLNAGTELEHIIAYYPYSSSVSAAKSGSNYTLDVVLPTEQTYVAESFGDGAMPMVAVSETNNITFRNVCGGMKLQLKGTQKVASIKVEGKNGELLSGAATVTAYTDETKPAITMASDASTSVTLNCGDGVQLNESTATEFILAMPPVLFSKGFTVTVADLDAKTYTVETDKANTVLRSSLLVMPVVQLNTFSGEDSGNNEELLIPVVSVSLNSESFSLSIGDVNQLKAVVKPNDATNKTVVWSSDKVEVATVNQEGLVTAVSDGIAKISAVAGGIISTCTVTVYALAVATADYIDEYGFNHGKGVAIGRTVWAPVNCGYHKDDFKYGKLYQWGRKYGQGYSGALYNNNESTEYSDGVMPTIEIGDISTITGNHLSKANVFFTSDDYKQDWSYTKDDTLWNYGTDIEPTKTPQDPCPNGWRIPTSSELDELIQNSSPWTEHEGLVGYWFSGTRTYAESETRVFFPAAGERSYYGEALNRGFCCEYWSSLASRMNWNGHWINSAQCLSWWSSSGFSSHVSSSGRGEGKSVRCVQE